MTPHSAARLALLWALGWALMALPAAAWERAVAQWERAGLNAAPLAMPATDVDSRTLRPAGALVLSSPDLRFTGLSGLAIARDGRRVLAVSDRGTFISMALRLDAAGRLVGASDLALTAIRDTDGQPVEADAADAEGLGVLADGRVAVSFERWQRVRLIDLDAGLGRAASPGPALEDLGTLAENRGLEALAVDREGRLVVGAERGARGANATPLWRAGPGPGAHGPVAPVARLQLAPGWGLCDLVQLPDGRWLTLTRFFVPLLGVRTQIGLLPARWTGTMRPVPLLRLSAPGLADNYEGIAVHAPATGPLRVMLVSDDDLDEGRTRLLAFDLDPDALPETPR
jgi:hypothetical protein